MFEEKILEALLSSENPASSGIFLQELFEQVAGDDVSLAVCAFGFQNWADLQSQFFQRYEVLTKEMKGLELADHWENYKIEYEKLLS